MDFNSNCMDFVPLKIFREEEPRREFRRSHAHHLSIRLTHSYSHFQLVNCLVAWIHFLEKLTNYKRFFKYLIEKLVTRSRLILRNPHVQ